MIAAVAKHRLSSGGDFRLIRVEPSGFEKDTHPFIVGGDS
jgi:hypothetical protein